MRRLPLLIAVLLVVVAVLGGAGYFLAPRFETEAPQVKLPDSDVIGLAPIEIEITDAGAGLTAVNATLVIGGTEHALVAEQFSQPVAGKKITVALPVKTGVKEGPAVLRISARDASLWRFFKGNETAIEKNLAIDITPPVLELIADDRYVNFGGVGVIVYKPSPDTAKSGVRIGDYFFPGFKGQIKDQPEHYIAMFAHAYNVPADQRAVLVATDKAGNTREMPLVYELKEVKYRKSTIPLNDAFLQSKVMMLIADVAARQGPPGQFFNAVNKALRKDNDDKIHAITSKGTPNILWQGAFAQLSNSKVEANFADERTYTYNGESISTAFHLGYDLSVTKRYPVEAANAGNVAFTGNLGIYGNTVIIDHGLGLFTLYSHLSSIDAKVGDAVTLRQIIGKTGETGLAAGDHLHYGVYLHGVAVLPVEWWDAKWINDNITPKLEGKTGDAIAEEQQKPRKAAGKAGKTAAKKGRK